MINKLESTFAIWCGLLIGIALGLIGTHVGWSKPLPEWTEGFYSGWVQTIGSLLAVYAAIRVGRDQVEANAKIREQELNDERRRALDLALRALAVASQAMEQLCQDPMLDEWPSKREKAIMKIVRNADTLREVLWMRVPEEIRDMVLEASTASERFVDVHSETPRPLTENDRATLRAEMMGALRVFKPIQRLIREDRAKRDASRGLRH